MIKLISLLNHWPLKEAVFSVEITTLMLFRKGGENLVSSLSALEYDEPSQHPPI